MYNFSFHEGMVVLNSVKFKPRLIVQIKCHLAAHTYVADNLFTAIILFNTVTPEAKKASISSKRVFEFYYTSLQNYRKTPFI